MKIAVCEDEAPMREILVSLIRGCQPQAEVFVYASGEALLSAGEDFNLALLDIALEGLSGMDLARALRQRQQARGGRKTVLLFVTGYRQYMEEAFDVEAYHYLLKPLDEEKFRRVFDRAWQEALLLADRETRQLLIRTGGASRAVYLKDIRFIESSNKQVLFHTAQGDFLARETMDRLEKTLGEGFYRCHRCYLVNLEHISAYQAGTVRLTTGEELLLAQKKYPHFIRAFLRHAQKGGIVRV